MTVSKIASFMTYSELNKNQVIRLQGSWIVRNLAVLKDSLDSFPFHKLKDLPGCLVIDARKIDDIDMGGSVALSDLIQQVKELGLSVKIEMSDYVKEHLTLSEKFVGNLPEKSIQSPLYLRKLESIGQQTIEIKNLNLHILSFLGEFFTRLVQVFIVPKNFRFRSFFKHLDVVGLKAIPIVTLISLLIGIVLAYQGITQLSRFGAQIYTVNLLGLGILREVGVLLTSIVIAGRSGSAFTAEIGMMVMNEEVNALKVMGLSPFYLLILPRVLALTVALPLLAFWSDIIALIGGAIMMNWLMDTSFVQYKNQLLGAITPTAFWVGMVKAPFFGFIISFVGCFEGMKVKATSESVGIHTTKSVVESIFLIIVLDAFFSILFAYLGI